MRLEMLQVARLSSRLLSDSAALVRDYIYSQIGPNGGFMDRGGRDDLYYTVFGLNCLLALQAEIPLARVRPYLEGFGDGEGLDCVHLCTLARCWACIQNEGLSPAAAQGILNRIDRFRAPDGGYNPQTEDPAHGTAYGSFLGLGAYQDLGRPLSRLDDMADAVLNLRTKDGGFADIPDIPASTTPNTAAGVTVLHALARSIPDGAEHWLLRRLHPEGGFFAIEGAVMPDLLSTATALHALACLGTDLSPLQDPCLDYIDSLWVNKGGFYGNWAEDVLDCEYTFYGLLALGHLSV